MTHETAPALLPQTLIHEVHEAVLSAGLDPASLLAELPPEIAASLPSVGTHAELLLSALSALNRMELDDGGRPLLTALRTAEMLTVSRKEAKTFRRAIELLDSKLGPSVPALPGISSSGSRGQLAGIAIGCAITAVASITLTLATHGVLFPSPKPAPCPLVADRLAARRISSDAGGA